MPGQRRQSRPFSLSLRTVVGFTFGLSALLLTLLLSVLVERMVGARLRADIVQDFQTMAFVVRSKLDQGLHERFADIRFAAANPLMGDAATPREVRRASLDQIKAANPDHAWIGFVDLAGTVIASTDSVLEGTNVSARPWFQGGLKGAYVGDVHEALLLAKHVPMRSGEPARFVDVAAPVHAPDGTVVGVIGSHVNWAWAEEIRDELLSASHTPGADILVVGRDNTVLLGSGTQGGTFRIPQSLLTSSTHASGSGGAYGDQFLAVSQSRGDRSFPDLGWRIVVAQDIDAALQPVRDLQREVLLWGGVIGLFFVLLGAFTADLIARPLRSTTAAADRLRIGDDTKLQIGRYFTFTEISGLYHSLRELYLNLLSKGDELRGVNSTLAQSLQRLNTLVMSAPLPITAFDIDGKVTLWNPAAERTFGFTAEEAIGGPPPHVPPEGMSGFYAAREGLRRGETYNGVERRLLRKDGTQVDVNLWLSPLRDEQGQMIGSLTIIKDVTQERAVEAQLRQSQKMEAVGQLTGGIAHDFNNLLGLILGHAELIAEELDHDTDLKQAAELIVETAERGARLTHQLLAFSRKQELAPEPLNINEVITNLTTLLARSLGEQVEIGTDLEPTLPKAIVDHAQLEAALLNLAVNARDAMPKGGRLLLETKAVTVDGEEFAGRLAPGSYIRVAVTDTGTGMPPEVVARVFEPFFTTKEVGRGTGLGLSMVYGFAKQSGGHIEVYSEPGVGTTISLYLPVAEGQAARADNGAIESVPHAAAETVLIVEDEPAFRHFLATTLEKLGYTVSAAPDGASALAEIDQGLAPDLLLTDVILPGGMNGRELAEQVHERYPGVPVLYMSGYPDTVLSDRGTLSPKVRLLRKPFRKAELAQALRAALPGGHIEDMRRKRSHAPS